MTTKCKRRSLISCYRGCRLVIPRLGDFRRLRRLGALLPGRHPGSIAEAERNRLPLNLRLCPVRLAATNRKPALAAGHLQIAAGGVDMFTTQKCEAGADAGKWYTVVIERQGVRRVGYCAFACPGHDSSAEALAHHLQYQLDREADLWLERRAAPRHCEICGGANTFPAGLGRDTLLFILCREHQSTASLQRLFQQRLAREAAPAAP